MKAGQRWLAVLAWIAIAGPVNAQQIRLLSAADPNRLSDAVGANPFEPAQTSADGRFVVFTSEALNLVPGQVDVPGTLDVFLFDRLAGTNTLVSHVPGSATQAAAKPFHLPGNDYASAVISADGGYVAFVSDSTALVAGQVDDNFRYDVFVFERATGIVSLVSHADGSPARAADAESRAPSISDDGSRIAFMSAAGDLVPGEVSPSIGLLNVFLYDRAAGTTALVSRASGTIATAADDASYFPTVSAAGSDVVFESDATNLLPGQTGGGGTNLFLYQVSTGAVSLVSHRWSSPTTGANSLSDGASISVNGAFVVFQSWSSDLVPGMAPPAGRNVYLYDRAVGTITLVSHAATSPALAANGESRGAVIDDSGNAIAFTSNATDLVAGQVDTVTAPNSGYDYDVFLYDRTSGSSTLVSRVAGTTATATNQLSTDAFISGDGQRLAYFSHGTDLVDGQVGPEGQGNVLVFERATGLNRIASHTSASAVTGSSGSAPAGISRDGAYIAFHTIATDLALPWADFDGLFDLVLYEAASDTRIGVSGSPPAMRSMTAGGASFIRSASQISADGRFTVFESYASNLTPDGDDDGVTDVFLYDRTAGTNTLLSRSPGSPSTAVGGSEPVISAAGDFAAYSVQGRLILLDRATGVTTLVSHLPGSPDQPASGGTEGGLSISPDGRWLAYASLAPDLVPGQMDSYLDGFGYDIFLFDRMTGENVLVSHAAGSSVQTGNQGSLAPQVSDDGAWVVFRSRATDLVAGGSDANSDTDVFLFERATGVVTLVSHAAGAADVAANQPSANPRLSADGRLVLFTSGATNLVPGQIDANSSEDVFVFDRVTGTTSLVSHAAGATSTATDGASWQAEMSTDGRFVAFVSAGTDVLATPVHAPNTPDVFLLDRVTGDVTLVSHTSGTTDQGAGGYGPQIDAAGNHVVFTSAGAILDPGVSPATANVFVFERATGDITLASHGATDQTPTGSPGDPSPQGFSTADGTSVLFTSKASDLVENDFNDSTDVFLFAMPSAVADLAVTLGVSPNPVPRRHAVTYAIDVANGGPDEAALVSTTLDLPAGVSFVGAAGAGWSCGMSGGHVACTRPRLAVGAAPTILVDARAPSASGPVSASVSVTGLRTDPAPGDNLAAADLTVDTTPVADLTIAMTGVAAPVRWRQSVRYVVDVTNGGPDDAQGAAVSVSTPSELEGVHWTCAAAAGSACAATGTDAISDSVGLPPGGSVRYTIDGTVKGGVSGGFTSTASVTAPPAISDPDASNDVASVETTIDDDTIFADGFEAQDLSVWSSTGGGSDLAVAPGGLAGTAFALSGVVDDRASLFVEDRTPVDEDRYRARFYIDPSGYDPGESAHAFRTRVFIVFEENPTRRLVALVLKRQSGQYGLMARVRTDDATQHDTGFFAITGAPHAVEIDWQRASGPSTADGRLRLWIDGVLRARVTGLSAYQSSVDFARLGALNIKAGAQGTLRWDEFVSRRTTYIGP
jgi:Tol biopolymer transport system component